MSLTYLAEDTLLPLTLFKWIEINVSQMMTSDDKEDDHRMYNACLRNV